MFILFLCCWLIDWVVDFIRSFCFHCHFNLKKTTHLTWLWLFSCIQSLWCLSPGSVLITEHSLLWLLLIVIFLCVFSCRYASLYFCCAIEEQDNELITLEVIHRFVELLDKYFGSVSHTFLNLCYLSLTLFSLSRSFSDMHTHSHYENSKDQIRLWTYVIAVRFFLFCFGFCYLQINIYTDSAQLWLLMIQVDNFYC